MFVVGPFVPGSSQVYHVGDHHFGCRIASVAAATAMSPGPGASLSVNSHGPPGVTGADNLRHSCLFQAHLLHYQVVQNLKLLVLFGDQGHFLNS